MSSKIPRIRSAYDSSRVAVVVKCGESRTKQSFKEAADVNSVLERYARTGVWSRVERQPLYGDVSMVEDFHTALSRVREAVQDVERLPERARERYREDPEAFLAGALRASSREELVDLGLLEDRPAEPDVEPKAEPAEPAAEPASAE